MRKPVTVTTILQKLNPRKKKFAVIFSVIALIISVIALIIIVWAGTSAHTRSQTYKSVIEAIYAEEYDTAASQLDSLPSDYKDVQNLKNYLTLRQSFDIYDRSCYAQILNDLSDIGSFDDDRLTDDYTAFQEQLLVLKEQYEADKAAAKIICDEISEITDDIGLEDKERIEKVRADYNNAPSEVQELVDNSEQLTSAEAKIKQLEKDHAKAQEVIEKIDKIGTVTLDSQDVLNDAWDSYHALSSDAQSYVTN